MKNYFKYFFETVVIILIINSNLFSQKIIHPRGEVLEINGRKIWYEIEGEGEPLLLIAGGGAGSHDYFHPYFSPLSKYFKVIYYDGYGRGYSERAENVNEYSFESDVDDIAGLIKKLNLGKVNLLGHSYSGFNAQAFALKYPDMVKRLILANTMMSGKDYQELTDRFNAAIGDMFPEIKEKVTELRAKGLKSSSPEMQEAYFEHFGKIFNYFYFYNVPDAPQFEFNEHSFNSELYYKLVGDDADFTIGGDTAPLDFSKDLKKITVPVLVIASRFDAVVYPGITYKFKNAAPHAKFVLFEQSGHYPFAEENEKFVETIKSFIKEN